MVTPGRKIVDRTGGRTRGRTTSPKADLHECFKFGPRGLMRVVLVIDLYGFDLLNTFGCFIPCFEGFFVVNSLIPANLNTKARGDLFFAYFLIKCNVLG